LWRNNQDLFDNPTFKLFIWITPQQLFQLPRLFIDLMELSFLLNLFLLIKNSQKKKYNPHSYN